MSKNTLHLIGRSCDRRQVPTNFIANDSLHRVRHLFFLRLTGLILMIVSIFPILAGLFITEELLPGFMSTVVLTIGVLLLAAGVVFYKIVKSD